MPHLQSYWEQRYIDEKTGWNIGEVSRPIKEYIDQLTDKSIDVLVPAGGHGFEAEHLYRSGFSNVHLLDFAQAPLDEFKARVTDFPDAQLHRADFFSHEGQYDLIIEQAFFCAIEPKLRDKYVQQMLATLKPGGKIAGLLFSQPFTGEGPPYGGSIEQYREHFGPHFTIHTMATAHNSIEKRAGEEVFIILQKP
jgi:SAM-dependent methyltransferase